MKIKVEVVHKVAAPPPVDHIKINLELTQREAQLLTSLMKTNITVPAMLVGHGSIDKRDQSEVAALMQKFSDALWEAK